MNYKELHKKLILNSGGKINDDIVIEPGVKIIAKTEITDEGKEIFDGLNIHSLPDFNSKITYLNFKDKNLEEIVTKLGHLSIYNDTNVTILITGVSVESELELLAHNEFKIARLTSSRTNAQLDPLFVIPKTYKNNINKFKEYIYSVKNLRIQFLKKPENKNELEAYNYLPYKAVSFTISGNLKDFHKTLIGRLSNEGVEIEVQNIFKKINTELRNHYPQLIKTIDWYYNQGNDKKYKG